MNQVVTRLLLEARTLGYQVVQHEQLRPNRWLLLLKDPNETQLLVLVQQRPLIASADVQDLAELLQLRRVERGYLVALGGAFSAFAQRTALEFGLGRITLCTQLPAVGRPATPTTVVFEIA